MGSQSIGAIISSRSVVVLAIQVFCFPWLASRLDIVRLHRWAMSFWIPTFALLPMVNLAARAQQPILVWTGLCLFMIVGSFAGMCQGESATRSRRRHTVTDAIPSQFATFS
jgi:hypothetical protein